MIEIIVMSSTFELIDIVRTVVILTFGVLSGWIIYRLMKSADRNEESKDSKDEEDDL